MRSKFCGFISLTNCELVFLGESIQSIRSECYPFHRARHCDKAVKGITHVRLPLDRPKKAIVGIPLREQGNLVSCEIEAKLLELRLEWCSCRVSSMTYSISED
jgi:hypothetical protein